MRARRAAIAAAGILSLATAFPAAAGGGPETTLVVVNAGSPDSLRVANAYARLRSIPESRLLFLEDVPAAPAVPVEEFRRRILGPILDHLSTAPGGGEVDTIAYSAGFPYSVDFATDAKEAGIAVAAPLSPGASLTSMTYLGRRVARKDAAYLDLHGNRYFRKFQVEAGGRLVWRESRGFRSRYEWRERERPRRDGDLDSLDRYWLAVMLAYTGERGTTAEEAVRYLEIAAGCDGTSPEGTVYLMENDDVRADTRERFFPSTVGALAAMGRRASILTKGRDGEDGVLPLRRDDVFGLVAGIAGFDWAKSGSRLLPGSIAEHLTSFGAHFAAQGQTKCTEFLKAGAAGTCGAVAEPYALAMKFPVPQVHVHYAAGCSLAEAFYQSVEGPYQLLVMGDPLARPFARFAKVSLTAPDPKAPWKGIVSLETSVEPAEGRPIALVEAWVDGAKVGEAPPGSPIPWDTTAAEDGLHDLRLVAVEEGTIETRSFARVAAGVANGSRVAKAKGPSKPVTLGDPVPLTGFVKGAATLEVRRGSRILTTLAWKGGSWKVEIPSASLGVGRSTLRVRAVAADGVGVLADPVEVEVVPPPPPKEEKPAKGKR
jgi:hypothetical protein